MLRRPQLCRRAKSGSQDETSLAVCLTLPFHLRRTERLEGARPAVRCSGLLCGWLATANTKRSSRCNGRIVIFVRPLRRLVVCGGNRNAVLGHARSPCVLTERQRTRD